MFETKCLGDNFKMLVAVLAILIIRIRHVCIRVGQEQSKYVTIIEIHDVTNITVITMNRGDSDVGDIVMLVTL